MTVGNFWAPWDLPTSHTFIWEAQECDINAWEAQGRGCMFILHQASLKWPFYFIQWPAGGLLWLQLYGQYSHYYKTLLNRRPSWIEDTAKVLRTNYKTLLFIRPNSATVWDRDMYNMVSWVVEFLFWVSKISEIFAKQSTILRENFDIL